ncbi:Hpt domain-containing protein [Clostridium sp. AM58-1XD]|uniref:Hpt domain-containing protein n=1 Tax=Clostridium sp. AM58-1XD TaxID=2292307 RepID=UPI000E4E79F9|nr:Hpt domain-containing protein [Clostridium sp. AM58-1XD]RGY95642.1 Hpt domain-containing protein [Clostridium sp. AM58-1XD]
MDVQNFYSMIEADGAVVLERFMGNKNLLIKFLKKFLADNNFQALSEALEADDYEKALVASHTLKGVSGNLGLAPLFQYSSEIVTAIREERLKDIAPAFEQLRVQYEKIILLIKELES